MIAIKDMEIPKNCAMCPLCESMGSNLHCPVARTHIDIRYTECRHPDCPLVEIEPLTDSEQRIFLSAMSREMSICRQIDNDKVDDSTVKKLVPIVNTIERKIKKVLWN